MPNAGPMGRQQLVPVKCVFDFFIFPRLSGRHGNEKNNPQQGSVFGLLHMGHLLTVIFSAQVLQSHLQHILHETICVEGTSGVSQILHTQSSVVAQCWKKALHSEADFAQFHGMDHTVAKT